MISAGKIMRTSDTEDKTKYDFIAYERTKYLEGRKLSTRIQEKILKSRPQ